MIETLAYPLSARNQHDQSQAKHRHLSLLPLSHSPSLVGFSSAHLLWQRVDVSDPGFTLVRFKLENPGDQEVTLSEDADNAAIA